MKQSVLHLPEGAVVRFGNVKARLVEPAHFAFDGDRDQVAVDLACQGEIEPFLSALEHKGTNAGGEPVTVKYDGFGNRHEFPIEEPAKLEGGDEANNQPTA